MAALLPNPFRIVILGGGLSGLSAAQTIVKYARVPCNVTILECQSRIGGWLDSTRFEDGTVFEHGPRTARSYGAVALQALTIISELGIDEKIIGIPNNSDAAKRRYIYSNDKMIELPSSFLSVIRRQEPFSQSLMSILAKEFFTKNSVVDDESVYDFFSRRFNKEIADYLSTSLCRGIFGGDAKLLSVRSCFRVLFDYEKKHGSVVKGMMFTKSDKPDRLSELALKSKRENWMAWTVENGMGTLPQQWSRKLESNNVNIRLGAKCHRVSFLNDYKVECLVENERIEADAIISALPACSLSSIVESENNHFSNLLSSVEYNNMAVITMEYKHEQIPFSGFGFLVPTTENVEILGATFDSLVLPHHAPNNSSIVTVMSGGSWFRELFGNPDECDSDCIKKHAIKNIKNILKFTSNPDRLVCKIHKNAIPQYNVGHDDKSDAIKSHLRFNNLPILMVGNTWGGVGVNDVIVNARNDTLRWLAAKHLF